MRRFILLGHSQKPDAAIPLNDPAGAGRWDVMARSVAAALLLSNGIRRDVEVYIVLRAGPKPRTLILRGADLRNLHPDERAILGLLGKALAAEPVGQHIADVAPGLGAANWDLDATLRNATQGGPLVLLHEQALLLESTQQAREIADATFVLSDHQEFSHDEYRSLANQARYRFSLGPQSLHTSACIVIVHNWLDRSLPPA